MPSVSLEPEASKDAVKSLAEEVNAAVGGTFATVFPAAL